MDALWLLEKAYKKSRHHVSGEWQDQFRWCFGGDGGDGDGGATQEADDASAKCTGAVDTLAFGERMTAVGLDYGPAFRGLVAATSGEQSAFGRLELAADDELSTSLRIHPGILDAAFHLIGVAMEAGERLMKKDLTPILQSLCFCIRVANNSRSRKELARMSIFFRVRLRFFSHRESRS